MELLYLWIEDYKNIHHQGFNFSPKYRFTFEPEFKRAADGNLPKDKDGNDIFEVFGGTLKDEMPDKARDNVLLENFFEPSREVQNAWKENHPNSNEKLGTITNITGIVGANGAGKSNLLEFLLIEVQPKLSNIKSDLKLNYNFFLIFRKEKRIFIFQMMEIKNLSNIEIEIWDRDYPDFRDNLNIFFSTQLNSNSDDVPKTISAGSHSNKANYYSISTSSLILNLSYPQEYFSQEVGRQLEFLTWNNSNNLTLPFITPDFISIKCKSEEISEMVVLDVDPLINNLKMAFHEFNKLIKKESLEERLRILNVLRIIKNYLIYVLQNEKKATVSNFISLFGKLNQKKIDIVEIKELLKDFFRPEINVTNFEKDLVKLSEDFENFLNEFSKICNIQIHSESVKVKVDDFKKIFHLLENIKFIFFEFKWRGLSSGEVNLLNLYSRFFSVIKTSIDVKMEDYKIATLLPKTDLAGYESVLLLIDEGEIGFHPEWQRTYLKNLIDFFPQIYPDKQIQIILTTHSPFLASDLPKENIIFLRKAEPKTEEDKFELVDGIEYERGKCIVADGLKKQTFGANIHTLLSDSFFLQDGLMGEFAKGKILDLIDNIEKISSDTKEKDIRTYESLIAIIGEPVLQQKLHGMLEDKLNKVEPKELKLKRLEEEKRKIEEVINEIKNAEDTTK